MGSAGVKFEASVQMRDCRPAETWPQGDGVVVAVVVGLLVLLAVVGDCGFSALTRQQINANRPTAASEATPRRYVATLMRLSWRSNKATRDDADERCRRS